MELYSEYVECRGVTFEVKELPMKTLGERIDQLTKEPGLQSQFEFIGAAVYKDGAPVGADYVGNLPQKVFEQLSSAVTKLNGGGSDDGDLGNE